MNDAVQYAMKVREMFGKGDSERDAGLKTPDDVVRYDDIIYGHDDEKMQQLDVYRPKESDGEKLPVIMNVHGGGWVYGSKEVYQYYCMSLAERGFAVVNFTYRLAPEWQYPASFEDACAVMNFILSQKDMYGFDTEHIFAVGDSAGAHMLSLLAAADTNPQYSTPYKIPEHFHFKAIALNCGIYHMHDDMDELNAKLMKVLLPQGGSNEELKEISAICHINENYPPCFIMTCPGDFLFSAPDELVPVLKENGIPFVYRVYGCRENPLKHVFHCDMHVPEGKLCNDEECAFFREFLD